MATDAANSTNTKDTNPSKTLDDPIPPPIKSPSTVSKTDADNTTATPTTPTASAFSDTEKKIRRAERFGITVQLSEQEKRNSRAERFGAAPVSQGSDAAKANEDLKRKARAERFGIPVPPTASNEDAKKKARLERFATSPKVNSEEEDKRKARAARFSQTPSVAPPMNGKGNIELNAAIEGKAGGGS